MAERRLPGLLLAYRNLGESDLLCDFFTEDLGRLAALVKGGKRSKKRFFGLLLTGHHLDLHLATTRSADLWRLSAAGLLTGHLGLRLDYRRFMAAAPVLELLLMATARHDPHPGALGLALFSLDRIQRARAKAELADALIIYLVRLLSILGYGLELGVCLECGRPLAGMQAATLSPAGGLVCRSCHGAPGALPAPVGLIRGLDAACRLEADQACRLRFPSDLAAPTLHFLAGFWRQVTGRDLPALGLAQRMLSANRVAGGPQR
jgi:DNA repair protein RecO (recombination protein O)